MSTFGQPNVRLSRQISVSSSSGSIDSVGDIEWTDTAVQIKELLVHALPQVLKVETKENRNISSEEHHSFDDELPLLLHSARRCSKILAKTLKWDNFLQTYVETGQQLVIPINYSGWFEILPETDGKAIEFFETISQIGSRAPERFLVRSPILGYQRVGRTMLRHQVHPGVVLKLVNVLYNENHARRSRGPLRKLTCCFEMFNWLENDEDDFFNEKYLHCVDSKDVDILLPYGRSGMFFPLGEPGTKRYDVVYQLCDIVRHLELPLIVQVIEGEPPTGQQKFSGIIQLEKEFCDETAIARTIGLLPHYKTMFEISSNSSLKFYRALNNKDIVKTRLYKTVLRQCDEKCDSYASSMKELKMPKDVIGASRRTSRISQSDIKEVKSLEVPNLANKQEYPNITGAMNRSLPPLPQGDPEEAFAYAEVKQAVQQDINDKEDGTLLENSIIDPDYDIISHVDEDDDYLIPNIDIISKEHEGFPSTSPYKNPTPLLKTPSKPSIDAMYSKVLKRRSPDEPNISASSRITNTSQLPAVEFSGISISSSEEKQSFPTQEDQDDRQLTYVTQQLEELFDISGDTEIDMDHTSVGGETDVSQPSTILACAHCVNDLAAGNAYTTNESISAIHEHHAEERHAYNPNAHQSVSESWLQDARKFSRAKEGVKTRGISEDNSVGSGRFKSNNSLVLRKSGRSERPCVFQLWTPKTYMAPLNTRENIGTGSLRESTLSGSTRRKLKNIDSSATLRMHNFKKISVALQSLPDFQESDGISENKFRRNGSHFSSLRSRKISTPERCVRPESISSTMSTKTDSGFPTPPRTLVHDYSQSNLSWDTGSNATTPDEFDAEWIPPYDVSSLSVIEVAKCLRYIGMKENVVRQFFEEQIDGKLFKELDSNLLKEGFTCLNAFERKKIVDFINGWRPRKL